MHTLADLAGAMRHIAPLQLAEKWDNAGLLLGSSSHPLNGPILLTVDLTERVLQEAIRADAAAVIAYHPPLFHPLNRITYATPTERIILAAIEAGIAIYSPHTALDAAPGGVTDWLCEGASGSREQGHIAGDCRALIPHRAAADGEVKIVTFVPPTELDTLRNALATAGAGIIGAYRLCSFAAEGVGTFFGSEQSTPAIGEAGRLESVIEHRLEMVCSRAALPIAIETLRQFHPYERPAIDIYELLSSPERRAGPGRRLVLDQPATAAQLAERMKKHLGIAVVSVALAGENDAPVTRIGLCPGSGAALAPIARAEECELFITGEMKHHELLDALHSGMTVILAGHTNTERGYLPRLARRLEQALPGLRTVVSATDRSPRIPV